MKLGLVLLFPTLCVGIGSAQFERSYHPTVNGLRQFIDSRVSGEADQFQWSEDSSALGYRIRLRDATRFYVVSSSTWSPASAFDHAKMADALTAIGANNVRADNLPISNVTPLGAGKVALLHNNVRYEYNPADNTLTRIAPPPRERPRFDHSFRIANHNVMFTPSRGGEEIAVTTVGEEGNRFTQTINSPTGEVAIFIRTIPGDDVRMPMIRSVPSEGFRPEVITIPYTLPGDKLPQYQIWTYRVGDKEAKEVAIEPVDYFGPPSFSWSSDGRRARYVQTHRGHNRVRLIEIDAYNGTAKVLVDEQSDKSIAPAIVFHRVFDDGAYIAWASERDGWTHLHWINGLTGQAERQITKGEWVVRSIERVDEYRRQAIITASGREPNQNPYYIDYYSLNLTTGGIRRITQGNGNHRAVFSPNGQWMVDTWSRMDMPPISVIREVATGQEVVKLAETDIQALRQAGYTMPEIFSAKGRDGQTDIWGVIWRPKNFDPNRKYAVVRSTYSGPHGSHVPVNWSPYSREQMLAEAGFIVVMMDGMGTLNRGREFHRVSYKNLGDAGLPDAKLWIQAAAKKYPYMDLSRVGIFGFSAGGYDAMRAMLVDGDFYKAAVSYCGNHDHRTDKTWWNEAWMGYPVGPRYDEQSNVTNAHLLKGDVLLIAGELDDNVNAYAGTLRLVDALVKANKSFDMLFMPGRNHNLGEMYLVRRMIDYFVDKLGSATAPESQERVTPREPLERAPLMPAPVSSLSR